MPKAFDDVNFPGKGLPKSLDSLRSALAGGIVADDDAPAGGAGPISADLGTYESSLTSVGTGDSLTMPAGSVVGQRKLLTYGAEAAGGDTIVVTAGGGVALEQAGMEGDAAPSAVTSVTLNAVGDYALFEFRGGSTPTWNLLYTNGTIA